MTREEFMKEAKKEIDQVLLTHRNRIMNLIQKAWAEGKKNAETSGIEEVVREAIDKIYQKPDTVTIPASSVDPLLYSHVITRCENDIPAGCRNCPNHPINGGSGICHCIIGTQPIMCNSTANDICDAIEKDKINVSDEICSAIGNLRDKEVYNSCCDNHIKIVHDMMTGTVPIDGQE